MTRFKKMSKSTVAVIVLALLLICSLAFGVTYAYFTGTAGSTTTNITTGHITLNLSDNVGTNVNRLTATPGDKLFDTVTVYTGEGYVFATTYDSNSTYWGYLTEATSDNRVGDFVELTSTTKPAKPTSQEELEAGAFFISATENYATNINIYFEVAVTVTVDDTTDPFDTKYLVLQDTDSLSDGTTFVSVTGDVNTAAVSTSGISQGVDSTTHSATVYYVWSSLVDYNSNDEVDDLDKTEFVLGDILISHFTTNTEQGKSFSIQFTVRAIQADNLRGVKSSDGTVTEPDSDTAIEYVTTTSSSDAGVCAVKIHKLICTYYSLAGGEPVVDTTTANGITVSNS